MKEKIEIPFKKKKIVLHFFGALVFVLLGVAFIGAGFKVKNQIFVQVFILLLGFLSVLFFGLVAMVILPKMVSNKPGMVITDEGLTDYSSGVSAGFIAWQDIRKIDFSLNGGHNFMVVIVNKPGKYIERESNFLKKWAMWMNYKISGSPIHLLVGFLDINLYALNEIIAEKRFRKNTSAV